MPVDDSGFDGLNGLIRLSGVNIPARAKFVSETLFGASLSSITLGLVCGQLGASSSIGPLVPFLFGSWAGYSLGLLNQWRNSKRKALMYADQYPALLRHSLESEWNMVVPQDESCLRTWILSGGVGRVTWSILAAQACQNAVNEIIQAQRQNIIDEKSEKN
mmetsp:Transcript_7762/g.12179  ORF Transcript_7762/g.12179 Transcript_7762/m.12179 type:complete len:161 (-) Transcript_7762:32-514(-)